MPGAPPTLGEPDRRRLEGEKARWRRQVWDLLGSSQVARFPFPPHDRIPNFEGALEAAARLAELPEFREARVVKVNPDAPQLPVRTAVLREGKQLVMAVPRLREERCFRLLEPGTRLAPTVARGVSQGRPLAPGEVPPIDLVVVGSVVVGPRGERIGKGGGFADLEWGVLSDFGKVSRETRVATTVHALQRTDRLLPVLPHDLPLDLAVTPQETVRFPPHLPRPHGILPEELTEATLSEVSWLKDFLTRSRRPKSL